MAPCGRGTAIIQGNRMGKVLLAALAVVMAPVAACGTGGSSSNALDKPMDKSVERAKIEQAVTARLTVMEGEPPKSVQCPQALKRAVKASTQCTVTTREGVNLPATATIESINGDAINLNVVSPWVSKTLLTRRLSEEITARVGQAPTKLACPGDLKSQEKATMQCTLTLAGGTTRPLTVSVTAVDGSRTEFHWSILPIL